MIVQLGDMDRVVHELSSQPRLALDTETTGLYAYKNDRLFSLIIAYESRPFYFNFQHYDGLSPHWVLPRDVLGRLAPLFADEHRTWYLHNAKFDLAMLAAEGVEIRGKIHCTLALGRVVYNEHQGYSLAESAARIGEKKDEAVDKYVEEHGLWEWVHIPGKKKRDKRKFFNQVPFSIIQPYGERDALVTHKLGCVQDAALSACSRSTPTGLPSILELAENEKKLTKTCFEMEKVGIQINRAYCEEAAAFETSSYEGAARRFLELTDIGFIDSGRVLSQAFTRMGERFPTTEKGNPSFTDDVLAGLDTPLAKCVQSYREAYKKANTYYRNFLYYADDHGVIHANIRQGGTATGRFSYSDPNLQNLNKEEDLTQTYLVRRAFVPRPGYLFVMLDYDQMEYRMMLDYAAEWELIEKVLSGLDVHLATAQMMGTDRTKAKMLNFLLLYGGGIQKLADALGVSYEEAQILRARYFRALPGVRRLVNEIMDTAKRRGFIFNWAGRRSFFPDSNFAYKAPNYLIQGGCADVVKFAMNRLAEFLRPFQSRMLIQIHDEILFEIHDSEIHLIPQLKSIMEGVYPARYLPLTVGVEHSTVSWADKQPGIPNGTQT